ncbi:ester cyclase [Flavobacterium rivuli]|uniref:ester cyclase n=1 Tax=Flavobacterium rivuli TaxID=498301 RepID=UPI0003AA0B4A|nr:ester cyclase [Flavobacterium rivuli]
MKKQSLLFAFTLCSLMAVSCKKNVSVDVSTDGTTADSSTTADKNIATVKKMNKAYVKNDIPNIFKNHAESFTEYGDGSFEPEEFKGTDSLIVYQKEWATAFPDFKIENDKYYSDGNDVVVVSDWSGTWKGDFKGQKPTGKSFKFKDAEIYTLKDGKITSHRSIMPIKPIAESTGFVWPTEKKK